ncbi:hypothetical protein [Streptomyces sp. NBC_01727]|uniref:hypothetical protein n=1 Tax=unclassified Streptomyces TaxID=2593676 RepID=UPI002E143A9D|nr:hypothetical protein OIE76_34300 [Streptomyces sp. NBC_01727]
MTLDPRIARIERLKAQNAELEERIVTRDQQLAPLTEFRTLLISRLAAQRDEIERLRRLVAHIGIVRQLPGAATNRVAPFGPVQLEKIPCLMVKNR